MTAALLGEVGEAPSGDCSSRKPADFLSAELSFPELVQALLHQTAAPFGLGD